MTAHAQVHFAEEWKCVLLQVSGFGRLADPEDIARYGPLSRPSNVRHGKTGDTGEYPENEVAQMAHTLAVKAITTT